jgi:HK97 gp10 family phage protein
MISSVKVSGLQELRRALEKLPKELQRRSETTALREGMKPVLKSARANAGKAKDTGLLQKSIGLNVRKGSKGVTARVGGRKGFKKTVTRKGRVELADPVRYAHLVEYGTSNTSARPFIRPAVDSNTAAISAGLAAGYQKGMDAAVAKVRSRK